MEATYYTLNGHTLGYVFAAEPGLFGVLAGKPQLGGHDWMNGPVAISPIDALKPATLADFDFFRVRPEGHIA